jgi:predicted RecB family nuclease
MSTYRFGLSKSRFLAGCQCLKKLYLQYHQPEMAAEPDEVKQAKFDQGHEVGMLATQAFPGGIIVEEGWHNLGEAMARTRDLMSDKTVPAIFEATFSYQGVLVRVDVLQRLPGNQWRLIEVKSTGRVKDEHYQDVAVQKYVLEGCGLEVSQSTLMHLNRDYVYDGVTLDLDQLFAIEDLSEEIVGLVEAVPGKLISMREALAQAEPPMVDPGDQCSNPYECDFFELCNEEPPEHWIGYLPGIRKTTIRELLAQGVQLIHEIPEDFGLSDVQRRACLCVTNGRPFFSPELLKDLQELRYPLYYMDFETFNPAIPRYAGMRPFDHIPFQWSVHVRLPGGQLEHYEFLAEDGSDPREPFIKSLLPILEDAGGNGHVVAYYASFETGRLDDLATWLPQYAPRIEGIKKRLWDLHPVVRQNVYHPDFYGSFSLKVVLPALVPHMTYEGMDIADGIAAGIAYDKMIKDSLPKSEKKHLRDALLQYCGQDTLAMVELIQTLQTRQGKGIQVAGTMIDPF